MSLRPAASGPAAAAVARFRLRDRRRPDRAVRRPPGAQAAEAHPRNRVRPLSAACRLAFPGQSRHLEDLTESAVMPDEPQNIYDDPGFLAGYSTLERFGAGWER